MKKKKSSSWIERKNHLIYPSRRKINGKMYRAFAGTGTLKDARVFATRLRKTSRKGAYSVRIMKCHVEGKGKAYGIYDRKTGKVFSHRSVKPVKP